VANGARVQVSLGGVNGLYNFAAALGFLAGDGNGSGTVDASDIQQTKGRSGQVADATNYRFDDNASGTVNASDILLVKGRSGTSLATPGATPAAPSGCTLSASPTTLPLGGGTVVLTATCASGNPTGFNWTGGSLLAHTAGGTQTTTSTVSTQFSVTPYNAYGSGSTATATVTVAADAISCDGFSATKVIDAVFPANGGATVRLYTYANIFPSGGPGWGAQDAIVLRFTAPAAGDLYLSFALAAIEGSIPRTMNLSTNACEFTRTASSIYYLEAGSLALAFSSGPSPYVRYTLTPGQTYYLNLANLEAGNWSCPESPCDAVILLQNPNP
jgi:hypothetical protein